MTKKVKQEILYNLNFLKSCGYDYMADIKLNESDQRGFDLPENIYQLADIAKECSLCELSKSRSNVIFGSGDISSEIMMIGDFPSISEDESGNILSGKYGQMLVNIVNKVLNRPLDKVYFTNVFKCKKSSSEVSKNMLHSCMPYLFQQIDIVKPKVIVLFGNETYRYFFEKSDANLNIIYGQFEEYKGIKVLTTYHPSFLVRNPSYKKDVMNHILKVKSFLEN